MDPELRHWLKSNRKEFGLDWPKRYKKTWLRLNVTFPAKKEELEVTAHLDSHELRQQFKPEMSQPEL